MAGPVCSAQTFVEGCSEVIGRTQELDAISRHLDAGGVLRLEGEPGIGKTTVWRAGVEQARDRGFRLLVSEPVEAERELSYTVLADLFEPVADDVLPALPGPQRSALERVFLVVDDDAPLDARLVGVAVRTSLASLGADALVAIDDAQWIDQATAAALAFALRRSPMPRALMAARSGLELPLKVQAETLPIGPISVGALHHLLVERLDVALQRTHLLRIHEISGGNPFYALELARVSQNACEFSLPPSLEHLVADRVRALPTMTRRALAELALGGQGEGLTSAIAAGIVEEAGGGVRFAHPLFAEAAVALLPPGKRRDLHAAIAKRTREPEQRARHLALAATGPDEEVAAGLAGAGQAAARRGAFASAAELWELAATLTPPEGEEHAVRAVEAGVAHVIAGNTEAGEALLEVNLDLIPAGALRQRGQVHLALRREREDPRVAVALLERVLSEVAEVQLRYEIVLLLARFLDRLNEPERADALAEEHLRCAEQEGDRVMLEDALLFAAARRLGADSQAWDLLDRAREIATERDDDRPCRAWGWAPMTVAYLREDRIDEARTALEEARVEAASVGSASHDYGLLWNRSIAELAAGNARLAHELADEALTVAEQIDEPSLVSFALMLAMFPAVVLGEIEAARSYGERALELAHRANSGPPTTNGVFMALGLLELSRGQVGAAAEFYRQLTFGLSRTSNVAGGRGSLDVIEAFAETGEVEWAANLAAGLPDDAHEKPLAEACVAAARDELERAIELVRSVEPSPAPFRAAREQLLLGRLLRRARRKRDARTALEAAREGFVALEASVWAERAAEELARLGGRRPAGTTLTASERRVAKLVASGLSNKEVASRLVVTVRTVEAHLTKVYDKLGVESRTALAAHWSDEE